MNQEISKRKLMWHGKEVKVEIVNVKVYTNAEKALWWYNYEIAIEASCQDYSLLEACKITTAKGFTFYISNHHGIGIRKLRKGGWPSHQHFGLPSLCESDIKVLMPNTSYCSRDFLRHEQERRIWQMKNFPDEFEASERLRKLIKPRY